MPPNFNAVHVILSEITDGTRISRPIGRVTIRRRDLIESTELFSDIWLPITHITNAPCTEILGDMCISTNFDSITKNLFVE